MAVGSRQHAFFFARASHPPRGEVAVDTRPGKQSSGIRGPANLCRRRHPAKRAPEHPSGGNMRSDAGAARRPQTGPTSSRARPARMPLAAPSRPSATFLSLVHILSSSFSPPSPQPRPGVAPARRTAAKCRRTENGGCATGGVLLLVRGVPGERGEREAGRGGKGRGRTRRREGRGGKGG